MNVHHSRISEDPPAWNRSRISVAGLRRMSGYSNRFPSSAKVALNESGATIKNTPGDLTP